MKADRRMLLPLLVGVLVASFLAVSLSGKTVLHSRLASTSPCQFQKADPGALAAFCETFDGPAGVGNRSGDLNGTLWGVSRHIGHTNFGQGQYEAASPATMNKCGTTVTVQPASDVAICNGMAVEAVNDDGDVTSLAMYPKQPFDFAGRTGTIAFDVSNDTHGGHRAWPELWVSDQPVPVPFTHFDSLQSVPRNGFGVRFSAFCPANEANCGLRPLCPTEPANVPIFSVESADVVTNYVSNDSATGGSVQVHMVGCVKGSSGVGDMNHLEVRVSSSEIDVWGTDAGNVSGPMTLLATVTGAPLNFTRGLVWVQDAHYNGDKDGPDQGTHTFSWDNFGFDGPALPRDLTFDVLDNNQPAGPYTNLGWVVDPGTGISPVLSTTGVYNVANASAAYVLTNYFTLTSVTLSVSVNGGPWHDQPWPYPAGVTTSELKTTAIPIPLAEVQAGVNTIQFKSSDPATAVSNVDILLVGAGSAPPPPATTTTLPATTVPSTVPPTTVPGCPPH